MIRKSDVQWWVLEAKKHPEAAPPIIEELAQRLAELDAENERLRDEIVRLQQRAPASADGSELSALQRKVATLQHLLEGEASNEPAVLFLSDRLQAARMPLPQVQRLAREGYPVPGIQAPLGLRPDASCPRLLVLARPQDELLLLTSQGRGLKMRPADAPFLVEGEDWPTTGGQELAEGERLTAAVAVTKPPRFWTVVTRRGYVRQFLRVALDRAVAQGDPVIESPLHNDEPVALVNGDEGDLLVLTRWGKGVRFSQRAIPGPGATALELEPDDEVVAALPLLSDGQVMILTAAGYAVRREMVKFAARSRPGGTGKTLIQAFDVLGALPCEREARLLYLTYSGKLALVAMADIPLYQRSRKGTRARDLSRDPAVAVMCISGSA